MIKFAICTQKRNDLGLFIRPFVNYRVDLLFESPFNLHRSNCYITPYFYILCMTSSILKYVDRYVNTAVHLLSILVMLTLFYQLRYGTIQRYSLWFPTYFPLHSSLQIEFSFLKLYQVSERNHLTRKVLYINYVYCIYCFYGKLSITLGNIVEYFPEIRKTSISRNLWTKHNLVWHTACVYLVYESIVVRIQRCVKWRQLACKDYVEKLTVIVIDYLKRIQLRLSFESRLFNHW